MPSVGRAEAKRWAKRSSALVGGVFRALQGCLGQLCLRGSECSGATPISPNPQVSSANPFQGNAAARPLRALKTTRGDLAVLVSVAALYFASGQAGLALAGGHRFGSPIWPPAGVALGMVLLLGYRIWPGVFLGALLTALVALWPPGRGHALALVWSSAIALGDTLASLVGAWLAKRFAQGRDAFREPHTILLFVALVAATSTALSATIGVLACGTARLVRWTSADLLWFNWWLADMASVTVLTPLVLVWATKRQPRLSLRRLAEAGVLMAMLVLGCGVAFDRWFLGAHIRAPLSFLVIPFLGWAALRFGQRGTTIATFVVAAGATLATLHGHGPFAMANRQAGLLLLQNFVGLVTILSLVLAADVAQRQRSEAGLRASEQRYRDLFENNPQPMWVYDYETLRFLAVNNAAVRHYGYAREEFLSMAITDIRPPEEVPALLQAVAQARAGLASPKRWRHRKQDGTLMDVEIARQNLVFDGRPAAIILSADITERIRAEAALRESDERLRLALAAGKMGTWSRELREGGRMTASPEMEATFGLKPGEFDGTERALFALIHPDDRDKVRNAMAEAAQREGDYELEFRFLPRDRPVGWLLTRGRVYFDTAGKPSHLAGVAIDITPQKLAEQEVVRLNAELEQRVQERTRQLEAANQELEAFCYSVSHDLRAPLRSIRGFSEVLRERFAAQLEPRAQDFLRRSWDSCQQMELLIEDLLRLSRVGRSQLRRQPVDLSALAVALAAELRLSEPHRAVQFIIAPGLHAQGDERLLRIVLENLFRNAWKFTSRKPKARIEFGATTEPRPALFVRDDGAGFDMAYAGKLFGVFQRLHSASEFPGTGVGLATVQRIVHRHGGRVWAEGAVDQGAVFFFSLPAYERG